MSEEDPTAERDPVQQQDAAEAGSVGEASSAELLRKVYEAREDPRELAESMGLSLAELAAWAGAPGTVAALKGLRALADMQTQLILSRYRLTAAAKLLALADQEDSGELARKACVDLLKLDLMPEASAGAASSASGAGSGASAEAGGGSQPADERRLLAALEALGRSSAEDDGSGENQA
jgi:hypothetical protein